MFKRQRRHVPPQMWRMTFYFISGVLVCFPLALLFGPGFVLMGGSAGVMIGLLWDAYRMK